MKYKIITIVIVILYLTLGRYLLVLENNFFIRIFFKWYVTVIIGFFTYGVYKLISIDEKH